MFRIVFRVIAVIAPLLGFLAPVRGADVEKPKGLTIGQVLQVNLGLSGMACAPRVLKDANGERMGCEPYSWTPAMSWRIAESIHKTEAIVKRYYGLRNAAVASLPRMQDGKVTGDAEAKFAERDDEMLNTDSGLVLDGFKRSDIELMKLPPNVLNQIWVLIDAP